ncbi:two-component regulator propeller domain-containing protein [Candidatus Parabeggiatoa sp. HSG14]|uniref:two-component regulator propeller domain-containing protein n=1 Tax=Candidatus Parabeggiatoa sp. HSG14 TaxID=3055593 RepID=UPI0025A7BD27|nr:two-component regulator propeller domain-containing protein [Thiotrichales bacterium HSG14]
MKYQIIKVIFFVFFIQPIFAQAIKFERLTVEDGLPSNFTSDVVQDDQGFMWFATKNGLAQYDGGEFTVYKHEPNNPNSLSNNYTWSIIKAHNGILWIGTLGGGLNKFDPMTEIFTIYKYEENNPNSLAGDSVEAIFEDKTGILWVGIDGDGLSKFDPVNENFVNYRHDENNPNSLSSNYVRSIRQDDSGIFWVSTYGGGLNRFDPTTETFTHYQHKDDNPNSLVSDFIWSTYLDQFGILWLTTEEGLGRYDIKNNQFTHYQHDENNPNSLSNNAVSSIYYDDSEGILWLGTTGGGLNHFDRVNFTSYQNEAGNQNSLSYNVVFGMTKDNTGTLWITTDNSISKYDAGNERFTHFQHNPLLSNSLSDNSVSAIYSDKNDIVWLGTKAGGLNKFEKQTFRSYQQNDSNTNSISDNAISVIKSDNDGILWIGTESNGINKFDPKTETFTHYQHDPNNPNSLNYNDVWDLDIDQNGILWIAMIGGGIDRFDPITETFQHYNPNESGNNFFATPWISSIKVATDGTIWIGTDHQGVSQFDPKQETFTYYIPDETIPNSLSNGVTHTIFEDSKSSIWIGTNEGLNKFDKSTQTFKAYRTENGLAGNGIFGILEDNQNYLWISTDKGLSKFDPQAETFRNYNKYDGLQGNMFLPRSAYKSKTGELFFGGTNGFNAFYPDKLTDNPHIPPVVLTDFKLFNQSVPIGGTSPLQQSINFAKQITLSHQQSVFSFEFTALNYRATAKNQYAYIMKGFDKDWTYVDNKRRFATYTNLDAGNYTFRVKASNNDGLWNETGTEIQLTILPPWWQTWWAYTIYAVIVLGSIIGIFIMQQKKLAYTRALVQIKELQVETVRLEAVEERNKMMMDSIQYAKVIQSSLLPIPDTEQLSTYLPNSFFVWMPRDVVGGDMLYIEPIVDGVIVAVIDCTGHGVPGAFMTMIVSTNLKRIIREGTYSSPADILKQLNFLVKTSLKQDTEHAKSDDGLDAALCLVKPQEKQLTFAGAKLPLYCVHNDKIKVIKGDKQSLGYKRSKVDFNFTTHTVAIEPDMSFYLSTDGFLDQLGGSKRFPFGSKRFKKLLLENDQQSFEKQSQTLLEAFNEYKGNNDRQDDVTIIKFGF